MSQKWLFLAVLPAVLHGTEVWAQRRLSLDEALALATGTSEQIAIGQAGERRAEANVRRTASQGLPQIGASAAYSRSLANQFSDLGGEEQPPPPPHCTGPFNPDPALPLEERVRLLEQRLACPQTGGFGGIDFSQLGFGAPNTWNAGLSFNWPFFTGGRVEAQVRASEAARNIARTNVTSSEAQVRLDVTQAYFDAQLADELVHISQASLANSEETLRLTELRANAGAQAEFDVLQARVTRDNQRPLLIRRQSQRELAYERLRALLDLPREEPLELTTSVSQAANREVGTAIDVAARIPVQQAAERVNAARHQLDAARAQRMPTISAVSQYGLVAYAENFLPSLDSFRKNWTVGFALQVPIYAGGRITADIDASRADVDEAEAQHEQLVETATLDTESALAELRAARATWEATQGTVDQAERGYDIARLRYREGVSIPLEVENARLLLEQARVNRAQAARDLWVAQTRVELLPFLPLSIGGGGQPGGAPMQPQVQPMQPQMQQPLAPVQQGGFPGQ